MRSRGGSQGEEHDFEAEEGRFVLCLHYIPMTVMISRKYFKAKPLDLKDLNNLNNLKNLTNLNNPKYLKYLKCLKVP